MQDCGLRIFVFFRVEGVGFVVEGRGSGVRGG